MPARCHVLSCSVICTHDAINPLHRVQVHNTSSSARAAVGVIAACRTRAQSNLPGSCTHCQSPLSMGRSSAALWKCWEIKKKKKNLVFVRHKAQNCAVGGGWRRGEVWGQQWAFAAQPELRMPMRRWNSLSPSAWALRKAVTKLAAIETLWRLYFGIRYSRHNHLHFVSQNHKTAWVKKDLRHHLCMPQSTSTMWPMGKLRHEREGRRASSPILTILAQKLRRRGREQGAKLPICVRRCPGCTAQHSQFAWGFLGLGGRGDAGGLDCLSGLPWLQGHPSRLGSTSRVQTGQRVTGSNPEVKSSSGDGKTNMSTQSMPYNLFQFTSSHAYKI